MSVNPQWKSQVSQGKTRSSERSSYGLARSSFTNSNAFEEILSIVSVSVRLVKKSPSRYSVKNIVKNLLSARELVVLITVCRCSTFTQPDDQQPRERKLHADQLCECLQEEYRLIDMSNWNCQMSQFRWIGITNDCGNKIVWLREICIRPEYPINCERTNIGCSFEKIDRIVPYFYSV